MESRLVGGAQYFKDHSTQGLFKESGESMWLGYPTIGHLSCMDPSGTAAAKIDTDRFPWLTPPEE
ncbi:hypothetical protein JRQ81_007592 [Phrynocephalus forsythii]|uniref:Uncharacterized protein n=1 Tax=Phrynocephalus forsythii TaxID=171643 RepID=A0A9Q1ATK4_9SAUR|nr:hypothetical protein JRQ81_007592 [Phrynocephalus forsythii]